MAVHVTVVVGVVISYMLGGFAMISPAQLQGDSMVIELKSWQKLEPAADAELVVTEPLKVEVSPNEVRIAQQRYHDTSVTTAPPTAVESAMAEQLAERLPPPRIERSARARDTEIASTDARAVVAATASSHRQAAAAPRVKGALPGSKVRLLESRPPEYPSQAELRGWEGRVLLRVHVAADGTVGHIAISSSSGHSILDAAAARAVRSWRFVPASCDGIPISSVEHIPVRFSLK